MLHEVFNTNYLLRNKLFNSKFKKRKNKYKRRKGKHLENLFLCRKRKFDLYYQLFDSKKIDKNLSLGNKVLKDNRNKKKFKLGIKSIEFDLIRSESLKSLKYVSKRYFRSKKLKKKIFKTGLNILPTYWLTGKPKSVRMGKGKGEQKFRVAFLKKGQDIFSLKLLKKLTLKKIKKRIYILKLCFFSMILIKSLKNKTTAKNVIYKKLY